MALYTSMTLIGPPRFIRILLFLFVLILVLRFLSTAPAPTPLPHESTKTDGGAAPLSTPLPTMATTSLGSVDLSWHMPLPGLVNNLTEVMTSRGVWDFVYSTSEMPAEKYGTYNWCNMPHVRASEYVVPDRSVYSLEFVEVIHRHHKRTPYASNAFPVEPYTWDCDGQGLFKYGVPFAASGSAHVDGSARGYWKGYTSEINPFVPRGWIGNCSFPQITVGGLDDSWTHGADIYGVYGTLLGFLPPRDDASWRDKVRFRVTQNQITSQVAGMVIAGLYGITDAIPLWIQADGIDSLEPGYSCKASSDAYKTIKSNANVNWTAHLTASQDLYNTLDSISGVAADDKGFHESWDHYYDNLSARQCHGKPLPCNISNPDLCIDQAMTDQVYRLGNWEYSQIYRDNPQSLGASVASMGVWFAELAEHLRVVAGLGGKDMLGGVKYMHNVAHDGSLSRVLSVLQVDSMVWPGMGSEVVFEVWRKKTSVSEKAPNGDNINKKGSGFYVRVLFGGQVLKSSNPSLGIMDMVPIETVLGYIDGLVGESASLIKGKCDGSIEL